MKNLLAGLVLSSTLVAHAWAGVNKIYGVNLGSWLVLESWMLPQAWSDMGGQFYNPICTVMCRAYAKAYPDTVDATFANHWDTWFTQDDIDSLKAAGINTIRVPRRGLNWLQDAGMQVILTHHALPGVQTPNQMFTGNCTSDVQFYTPYNYHRALVWTVVMTALSHLDPNFGSVFAIEGINEPITDAAQTPDYGTFQKNFVSTMRAVELALGISVPSMSLSVPSSLSNNFTATLSAASSDTNFTADVQSALADAVPILVEIGVQYGLQTILEASSFKKSPSSSPLVTNFMDVNWQYNNPPNPADAANGPQAYDDHCVFLVGPGVTCSFCKDLSLIQTDAAVGNSPLWFGEWSLSTEFNATDDFLSQWADAQKLAYSQGAGWIFWNFKIEISNLTNGTELARQWSYLEGVKLGYLTQDPSQLNNASVCEPYINATTSTRRTHCRHLFLFFISFQFLSFGVMSM
ncbi:glycoside hydrolase family 5 protein [Rhizopogon salebrosus TDB-379]|nr:glycoside hydrolase family 5 protein [Rhizopogon salebrosus TDB-379]